MICPKCGKDDQQKVLETRKRSTSYVLRRRECVCGHRFNSVEMLELDAKSMMAIRREMRRNSQPRAFEKMIGEIYLKTFSRNRYYRTETE